MKVAFSNYHFRRCDSSISSNSLSSYKSLNKRSQSLQYKGQKQALTTYGISDTVDKQVPSHYQNSAVDLVLKFGSRDISTTSMYFLHLKNSDSALPDRADSVDSPSGNLSESQQHAITCHLSPWGHTMASTSITSLKDVEMRRPLTHRHTHTSIQ